MTNSIKALLSVLLLTLIGQSQAMFTRNLGNLSRFATKRLSPINGTFTTPTNAWLSKPWVRRAALFGAPTAAAATTAYVGTSIANDMLQESRLETLAAKKKIEPFYGLPGKRPAGATINIKAKGNIQQTLVLPWAADSSKTPKKDDMTNFRSFGATYGKCINAQVYAAEQPTTAYNYPIKLKEPCLTVSSILNNNIAQDVADNKLKDNKWYYPFHEDARRRLGNTAPLAPYFDRGQYWIQDLKIDLDEKNKFNVSGKFLSNQREISPEALLLKKYGKEFSQCMKNRNDWENFTCRALKTPQIKAGMPGVTFDEFDVDVTFDGYEKE